MYDKIKQLAGEADSEKRYLPHSKPTSGFEWATVRVLWCKKQKAQLVGCASSWKIAANSILAGQGVIIGQQSPCEIYPDFRRLQGEVTFGRVDRNCHPLKANVGL